MNAFKILSGCSVCLTATAKCPLDCSHCQLPFCHDCLLKHQRSDLRARLLKQIQQIDTIIARFVGHAHNQTEWVDHLAQDRNDLQTFVHCIERTPSDLAVLYLPTDQWLSHVDDLIDKYRFAVDEKCTWLLRPPKTGITNSKKLTLTKKLSV
jgi:hypothetical protein